MEFLFINIIADEINRSAVAVTGFLFIIDVALSFIFNFFIALLRSPSVIIPLIFFWLSIKTAQPYFFSVISSTASIMEASCFINGRSVSIISERVFNFFPIFPPGCKSLNAFLSNSLRSNKQQQRASPRAKAIVVDVVGMVDNLSASWWGGSIKFISEFLANKLFLFEQIEIILIDCFLAKSRRSLSSWDSPEFERTINMSSTLTIPISP